MKSHAKGCSFDLWVVQYPFAFWPLILQSYDLCGWVKTRLVVKIAPSLGNTHPTTFNYS